MECTHIFLQPYKKSDVPEDLHPGIGKRKKNEPTHNTKSQAARGNGATTKELQKYNYQDHPR